MIWVVVFLFVVHNSFLQPIFFFLWHYVLLDPNSCSVLIIQNSRGHANSIIHFFFLLLCFKNPINQGDMGKQKVDKNILWILKHGNFVRSVFAWRTKNNHNNFIGLIREIECTLHRTSQRKYNKVTKVVGIDYIWILWPCSYNL